jgi:formylglycine-generating enzyme required for sulfatase activity
MGETPVTVGAYKRYANIGKLMPYDDDDNLPWVNVSWDEAASYCKWAGGRLPTEAEWEYAARAGSTAARYGPLDDIAWYYQNSNRDVWPVRHKWPNPLGLFDTLGNVWEWTADWYSREYYKMSEKQDPRGPTEGSSRSLRGGSWSNTPREARVSCRRGFEQRYWEYDWEYDNVGFRCVLDADSA